MADAGAPVAFLQLLRERAAVDPAYLAWVVRLHAEAEGRTMTDVLVQIGVTENSASGFLLSLRPTGELFADMLDTTCVRFGAEQTALLAVLREVEVLEAFRSGSPSGSSGAASAEAGILIAARMRQRKNQSSNADETAKVRHNDEHGRDGGGDAR